MREQQPRYLHVARLTGRTQRGRRHARPPGPGAKPKRADVPVNIGALLEQAASRCDVATIRGSVKRCAPIGICILDRDAALQQQLGDGGVAVPTGRHERRTTAAIALVDARAGLD